MKSLYQSVFSTIISKYDDKIDAANKAKDAAIDALEAEKDAALEAIEAERDAKLDAIDAQIDALESEIKVKEKEIEAIQDANKAKQEELDLEKAKYELERLQNQRTNLVYHSDKGFIYEADQSAVRDQKQAVEDAETEIRISAIEKEISVLEERRDALEDQRDAIEEYYDKLLEQTEKSYDQLIKQTEAYWDSVISGLEDYKSRYEELADMESDAKAMADLEALCDSLGITVDEVLSMSDEAFQSFRNGYTGVLADIYSGNNQMLDSFSQLSGIDMSSLNGHLAETEEYINRMKELDLTDMGTAIESIGEVFGTVADSVGEATNAIAGGGGGSEGGSGEGGSTGGASGGEGGSSDSLVGAIETTKEASDTTFGTGDDEQGLIGQTKKVQENIVDTTAAIGSGEEGEEGGNLISSIETLGETTAEQIGESGGEGVTGKFERFAEPIAEANSDLSGMKSTLEELDGKKYTVELEIKGGGGLFGFGNTVAQFYEDGTEGHAFATGTQGLKHDEELAVRSEYYQPELTVFPDGTAELTDSPTAGFLPKDTVIFNEDQTKKILKNKGTVVGNAYASGTVSESNSLPNNFRPIQAEDRMYELIKKFESYQDKISMQVISPLTNIDRNIDNIKNTINNISTISKSSNPVTNVNIGDIHLHEVQNIDTLAKTIVNRLPTMVMQEIHKR